MLFEILGDWKPVAEYFFPWGQEPWSRVNPHTKRNLQSLTEYKKVIADLAREQNQPKAPQGQQTLMVIRYYVHKSRGDQTNNAKAIEDGLNRIAYHDDKQNRQVVILETYIPKTRYEYSVVEIFTGTTPTMEFNDDGPIL